MQFAKSTLLVIVGLCLLLEFGSAIKCYRCTGKSDCKKPEKITCSAGVTGCLKGTADSDPYVAKDCAVDGNGKPLDLGLDGCVDQNVSGTKMKLCECKSEFP